MESLVYTSCTQLPCIATSRAPIIICVKDTIELVSGGHTLPALLITSTNDDCSCPSSWSYTVSYDEELLSNPELLLVASDITEIFCETCFTDWVQELTGNTNVNGFIFGDGSDGDVTWPQATPTQDKNYNNLTIPLGQTINVSGNGSDPVIIRVRDTLVISGTFLALGATGGDASGATGGVGEFEHGITGTIGDGGSPVGNLPPNITNSGNGGASGDGGNGAGHIGGVGLAGVINPFNGPRYLTPVPINRGTTLFWENYGAPGQSGAAGGGDNVNAGGGGGAGGSGAVDIIIFSRHIVLSSTGIIRAQGGAGGNGGNGVAGNTGGGGGAGGGGGGAMYIVYESFSIASGALVESVSGVKGLKGLKSGTGTDGFDGTDAGTPGVILKFNLVTGELE